MSNKHTAKTQITIHGPANRVWKALTTPALIKQYMMGSDVTSDWKVGGPLVYTGTYQGKKFEEKGVIQKIEPNKLLSATHFSASSGKEDKPENYALVTWDLNETAGTTVVSVSQDNIADEQGVEASKRNWTAVLQGLKKVVDEA